jgi:RHH-type transcriptional regulator, rel operon repressor / antitoxin RelB
MVQVTARLPDTLCAELDAAAQQLNLCRADIIRKAIEYYLYNIEDLRCGVAALLPVLRSRVNSKDCGAYGWAITAWSTNGGADNW